MFGALVGVTAAGGHPKSVLSVLTDPVARAGANAHKPASDRSTVGVYFAKGTSTSRAIRAVPLQPGQTTSIDDAMQALAVRASDAPSDVRVRVDAIRPDGSRTAVAAFVTRAGWDQRYWLARPLELPKGSRLEVHTVVNAVATARAGQLESIRLWLDGGT